MIKPEYNPDLFFDWFELSIRFRDLDPLNHVNNAIFSTYYEEARIHFIRNVPEINRELENKKSFVLATLNINFIRPAEYPATLLIGSSIKKMGNTSITSFQAIYRLDDKSLLSTAEATGVWFDLEKNRPTKIPEIAHKKALYWDPENE